MNGDEFDIFDSAFLPVRGQSDDSQGQPERKLSSKSSSSLDLDNYQQESAPQKKSLKELRTMIDSSPFGSVSDRLAKFNKFTTPVFPTDPKAGLKKKLSTPAPVKGATERQQKSSEASEGNEQEKLEGIAERKADENVKVESVAPPSGVTSPPSEDATVPDVLDLMKLAEAEGCLPAMERLKAGIKSTIVIKHGNAKLLVRSMELMLKPDQGMLVMMRKDAMRYVRLNDLVRLDASNDCITFIRKEELPVAQKNKFPSALHFSTTSNPMVIFCDTAADRESLRQVICLLRATLRTNNPLEVVA